MTQQQYRVLKFIAVAMALIFVAWSLYDYLIVGKSPGDYAYHAGSNYFADGNYEQALREYQKALSEAPDHLAAKQGMAETLIMLRQERKAIEIYNELIAEQPEFPGHYANRGIAFDRLGQHRKALDDYETALNMDPEVAGGPNWLTRFLRNQAEKPPGISERAAYLKAQFSLPSNQRVLSDAEIDNSQRPYKE